MRPNEFRSRPPKDRASAKWLGKPTRGTLQTIICGDYAAFAAALCACVSKYLVRAAVPGTKPTIRAQMQNDNSPIHVTHISIAKFGWLGVAQALSDILYDALSP
jgi:hypothetical protein